MATDRLTDDESCEKLLDESVKELDEDEEDCIKHLLNALERDEAEANEKYWEGRQLLAKDRGLMLDYNDRGNESVNASVSDLNTSKLKLDITANNVPPKGTEIKFSKISPSSSDKQRRAMKLLKKHKSETGKIICGIVIMLIILGIGGSLLVLGWIMDMEDLYLLGGIFAFGGVIFTIALIVVRCQTREQLGDTDYSVLYKA
ncbi:uncharacterized protein LOC123563186 [Mercenaria mercenaria]|uniref:uncharacterized protein LOC123563186 n=1 Tax=Mercenaria mercenaria TaxID=6596 RepID=UPI00234F1523|nr:uncharacterized protein LOC123563186 [Mercenaria mercenaria]XP_045211765.2 uncharacterized protein LOC123563186 [Mercenaria mercenaria]